MAAATLTVNARAKVVDGQGFLWSPPDTPLRTMAQSRNYSGEFFEVATASLLAGVRLRTSGDADVCPDVLIEPGLYAESKGVGRSGGVIVYQHRKRKDQAWTRQHGARLLYAIWNHVAPCADARSVCDLHARLASGVRDVLLIPSDALYAHCDDAAARVLNTKPRNARGNGFGCPNYRDGWTIRTSRLRRACSFTGFAPVSSFGRSFVVTVHTYPEFSRLLYRSRAV